MNAPGSFGRSTVLTVLRNQRDVYADNARRARTDVHQLARYEEIVAAFDEAIALIERTATKPALKAVAA